jgi:hypothetical protein
MAETVYVLCALTSIACAVMLFRGYARSRARLLLWSSLCFVGLALNNVLLFIDKVLIPQDEVLTIYRSAAALVGLSLLIYGLVWDTE